MQTKLKRQDFLLPYPIFQKFESIPNERPNRLKIRDSHGGKIRLKY